jgi:hypothetical protein
MTPTNGVPQISPLLSDGHPPGMTKIQPPLLDQLLPSRMQVATFSGTLSRETRHS